jgi:hypothetical protein
VNSNSIERFRACTLCGAAVWRMAVIATMFDDGLRVVPAVFLFLLGMLPYAILFLVASHMGRAALITATVVIAALDVVAGAFPLRCG